MPETVRLMIGGKICKADQQFNRISPLTGEIATTADAASIDDALAAVEAANAALPAWSAFGPNQRRARLTRALECLEGRADQFVHAMMDEIGATEGWARFNVMLACSMIREAAAITTQIGGEVIPSDKPGLIAMAVREPAGVVLGIAPWNAPVILGVRSIVVPLACGNTVVFKASEVCPRTHALIAEAFVEAGFDNGELNLVTNAPQDAGDIVGAMIDHPAVRRVNFTGSTHVGRIIAQRAAQTLTPTLLELGGKAPMIILADADLDEAVKAAAFGAFMNQGQICMSTERIIVDESVADAFVERFARKAASLSTGDPRGGNVALGAVVDLATIEKVSALIEEALRAGAYLAAGSGREGLVMDAHVVDRVTPDMRLFREESFGPVVAVVRARDADHAIELANDSEYGLSSAIFTQDIARGLKLARRVKSGICHVNGPTVQDEAQMPFGGVKASGYGRFGGKAGIDAFTELRWITVETEAGHYPI